MNSLKIQSLVQTSATLPKVEIDEQSIKEFYGFIRKIHDKVWRFGKNAKNISDTLGIQPFTNELSILDMEVEKAVLEYFEELAGAPLDEEAQNEGLVRIKSSFTRAYLAIIAKLPVIDFVNKSEVLVTLGYMRNQTDYRAQRIARQEKEFLERVEQKIKTYDFTRSFDEGTQGELRLLKNNHLRPLGDSSNRLWTMVGEDETQKLSKLDELYFSVLELYAHYTANNNLKSGDNKLEVACKRLSSSDSFTELLRVLSSSSLKEQVSSMQKIVKKIAESGINNLDFSQIAHLIYIKAFDVKANVLNDYISMQNQLTNSK